jgi:heat-inducible transcriptional repressor
MLRLLLYRPSLLTVVLVDTGHVDQRIVEVSAEVDDEFLSDLRLRINAAMVGAGLYEAAQKLAAVAGLFPADRMTVVTSVVASLVEQVTANRPEKLIIAGASNLVRTEEDFSGSILPVLEAVEEQVVLLRLFSEMEADERGISVSIGRENASFGLSETSVLASGYSSAGGAVARVGVIGPTRMDYSTNIAAVRAVARYLSESLGES